MMMIQQGILWLVCSHLKSPPVGEGEEGEGEEVGGCSVGGVVCGGGGGGVVHKGGGVEGEKLFN